MVKPAHLKAAVASDLKFDSLKDLVNDIPDVESAAAVPASASSSAKQTRPARAHPAKSNIVARNKRKVDDKATATRPKKRRELAGSAAVAATGTAAADREGTAALPGGAAALRVAGTTGTQNAVAKAVRVTAQVARAAASDEDYDEDSS